MSLFEPTGRYFILVSTIAWQFNLSAAPPNSNAEYSPNRRPRFLNRLSYTGSQVDPAVVHYNDVIAPEHGNQALLDIGEEYLTAQTLRIRKT